MKYIVKADALPERFSILSIIHSGESTVSPQSEPFRILVITEDPVHTASAKWVFSRLIDEKVAHVTFAYSLTSAFNALFRLPSFDCVLTMLDFTPGFYGEGITHVMQLQEAVPAHTPAGLLFSGIAINVCPKTRCIICSGNVENETALEQILRHTMHRGNSAYRRIAYASALAIQFFDQWDPDTQLFTNKPSEEQRNGIDWAKAMEQSQLFPEAAPLLQLRMTAATS